MEPIDWEEIYIQLFAYTDQLLKTYSWFRKDKPDSYLKGKQIEDYVQDAIEKYLLEPEKYDPSSGRSLVTYLKWHIIRSSVGNDARSPENKTSMPVLSGDNSADDDDPFCNIESFLPFVKPAFDENIDYKEILKQIHNDLQGDEMAQIIFEEVRCRGMDRREVIKKHSIEDKDFDNGMKRMNRVLKKVAQKYKL